MAGRGPGLPVKITKRDAQAAHAMARKAVLYEISQLLAKDVDRDGNEWVAHAGGNTARWFWKECRLQLRDIARIVRKSRPQLPVSPLGDP